MAVRVVHLSSEVGWRGGERQVWLLCRGLVRQGWDQVLAAPDGAPLARGVSELDVPVLALRRGHPLHPVNLFRLVRWLRGLGPAVVHAHTSPTLTLAALARRMAPAAAVVHTRRVAYPLRGSAKYRTAADAYVAISQAIGDQLLAGGLDRKRLRILYSAVDVEPLDAAAPVAVLQKERRRPLVGCVGQLAPEKGHAILLEAWAQVVNQLPSAQLVLVGDGDEREAIEQWAARLPPGSVRFAGHCQNVPPWLKALDLYVQPSLAEGLGTSVLDAMACCLPVVASRVGGLPEAVSNGETGLLVPPDEPQDLAEAILALLRDPDRAAAMGRAGRSRVERLFSVDGMVEGYADLYRELLAGYRTGA